MEICKDCIDKYREPDELELQEGRCKHCREEKRIVEDTEDSV